jgi:hypothetical protein
VRPLHPNLRAGIAAKDPAIRTLVEAQSEARSDVLRTKADLQTADTFVARTADFTAANALVAAAQTVEAALASAPAANALYDPHFKVTINPIIPGVGTTSHKVVVAVETDPTGVGVWTEQYNFEYEVIKKVGELNTPIVWPSERMPVRVPGFTAAGKLRLKVKSASGPGGWSFSVHGFNLATDGDLLAGVTYHTGPAIDFLDGGGATLANVVLSKLSHAVTDSYETDLGGPALSPDVAPFVVARSVWGKDDSKDIAIDRFTAQLHPCNDGVPGNKEVVWFLCQPFALARVALLNPINPISLTEYIASLVPLSDPVRVPAGPGTAAQDYVFSFSDRSVTGPGHTIVTLSRKPRPKSIQPVFEQSKGALEHDQSATTFWFVWAVKADGSAAGNVGWARNTAVTEVVNGSRKLRTVQVRRDNSNWAIEGPSTMGAAPRPVFRCSIQCGSYAAAELDYTGGGNLIDLTAAPTQTVMFVAIAGVPDGTGSVFEVRNDADSAWLPFLDGQTAAEVGVSQRQTYKVRWRGSPNAQGDASPTFWEMGARDLAKTWLSDLIASVRARWAIPNVAELTAADPRGRVRPDQERRAGLQRPGDEAALDELRGQPGVPGLARRSQPAALGVAAQGRLHAARRLRPARGRCDDHRAFAARVRERRPARLQHDEPAAHAPAVRQQDAEAGLRRDRGQPARADIPARYRGEGIIDESCIITKLIDASDGLTELNAIAHIADVVLSTSAGRLKSVPDGCTRRAAGALPVGEAAVALDWSGPAPAGPPLFREVRLRHARPEVQRRGALHQRQRHPRDEPAAQPDRCRHRAARRRVPLDSDRGARQARRAAAREPPRRRDARLVVPRVPSRIPSSSSATVSPSRQNASLRAIPARPSSARSRARSGPSRASSITISRARNSASGFRVTPTSSARAIRRS